MASGGLLRIEHGLARLLWADPDQDQLDVWEVRLESGSFAEDGDGERRVVWTSVAHSRDSASYYEHVFDDNGRLLPDAAEQFEWPHGRALFLHDVHVAEEHRRQGFASLLAADAILTLAPHGTAVFAQPGPTDLYPDGADDVRHLRHQTRNTRFLGRLGFIPFRNHLWTLDLSAGTAAETLAQLRRPVQP